MKKLIFIFCIVLLACNQNQPQFKKYGKGISFKYVQFGEGEKPLPNDVLQLKLIVTNSLGDSIHYVPDYNYFLPKKNHKIDSAIRQFKEGDSIILKVNRKDFNEYLKFYKVLQTDSGTVFLHIRLYGAFSENEAKEVKRKELSKRELREQLLLKKYLDSYNDSIEFIGGIYKQIKHRTNGTPVKYGSEVSIHYIGYFLNGYVFDNTYEKLITPSFTFGQEYQMIDGLQTAINGMKEGERVKIILPSRHAFGGEGSLAGIVPPYTAVIYEVNIIKVIN